MMAIAYKILENIPFEIDMAAFLADMRVKPGSRRDGLCRTLVQQVNDTAKPKVGWIEAVVDTVDSCGMVLSGQRFEGSLFEGRLVQGQKVYPFLSTCGLEIGDFDQQFGTDVLQQYWADCLMEKVLRYASDALEKELSTAIDDEFLAC
ncbi:MAG: hypothetical protein RRY35_05860, partial [Clostridiales bacterium]